MDLKTILGAGAAAASLALAGGASAAVVTFDSLHTTTTIPAYGSHYDEAGLSFDVFGAGGGPEEIGIFGSNTAADADPAGATIFVDASSASIVISKTGGGTFDFNSIDLTDQANGLIARLNYNLAYTYVDSGGSHSGIFALDSLPGLQTFTLNLTGVQTFTMFTGDSNDNLGPGVQLDNVRFDESTTSVPEPVSWALMIGGFGLAGTALRLRRKVAVA